MCCKNNIFAYNLSTGQVARWVFVGQTRMSAPGGAGEKAP